MMEGLYFLFKRIQCNLLVWLFKWKRFWYILYIKENNERQLMYFIH